MLEWVNHTELSGFVVMDTAKGLRVTIALTVQVEVSIIFTISLLPLSASFLSPPVTLALGCSGSAEILRRTRPPLGLKSPYERVDVPCS